jgi:hypothetical protein
VPHPRRALPFAQHGPRAAPDPDHRARLNGGRSAARAVTKVSSLWIFEMCAALLLARIEQPERPDNE